MHQTRHRESETESIIGSQNPDENTQYKHTQHKRTTYYILQAICRKQLTAKFQQHMMHYLLVAPVFFALVFTFYAYLSESVSTH